MSSSHATLAPRTRFRPCIDLHSGRVKQIVGGTLTDDGVGLVTNFESEFPPRHFAEIYRRDAVHGGHIIMLGKGNDAAASEALAAWPGGLQLGGGINAENAKHWLDAGASHLIVTSWLFTPEGQFLPERLKELVQTVGKSRLVIDLSCRRRVAGVDSEPSWTVCMNRWQTRTSLDLSPPVLAELGKSCDEFLIHAADVEGRRAGMDEALITALAAWSPVPVTYAGGAASLTDLSRTQELSQGKVDLTIGSALDLFGGNLPYADCVAWNSGR